MNVNQDTLAKRGLLSVKSAETPSARVRSDRGRVAVEGSLTFIAFIVLFGIYSAWLGQRFLNWDARLLDVHQSVPTVLLGFAVLVTLVSGKFDLSIASVASLSVYLTVGLTVRDGLPFPLVLAIVLVMGVAVGIVNGLLVERLGVNTFIATLGTGSVVLGFSRVYSGGSVISAGDWTLPSWFTAFGSFGQKIPLALVVIAALALAVGVFFALARIRPERVSPSAWRLTRLVLVLVIAALLLTVGFPFLSGIPWSVLILIFAALLLWILMDNTSFGRHLRAAGSNPEAARLAGVPVSREIMKAFILGGVLAALAGVVLAAGQGSASPDAAGGFLLPAFAAAFLSTVIFSNGRFNVLGTILGGVFVVWTSIGLVIGGVPQTWTNVINGVVLVAAVALSTYVRRRRVVG